MVSSLPCSFRGRPGTLISASTSLTYCFYSPNLIFLLNNQTPFFSFIGPYPFPKALPIFSVLPIFFMLWICCRSPQTKVDGLLSIPSSEPCRQRVGKGQTDRHTMQMGLLDAARVPSRDGAQDHAAGLRVTVGSERERQINIPYKIKLDIY